MKLLMAAMALTLSAGMGMSAVLNFAAEADANGERGGASETLTLDGQEVTLSANGNNAYYLDSGNAGLGVCSTGLTGSNQCVVSSDDNIQGTEEVFVQFTKDDDEQVRVTEMTFRKANHSLLSEGDEVLVSFDGGTTYETHVTGADGKVVFAGDGKITDGDTIAVMQSTGEPEIYLSSMTAYVEPGIDVRGPEPVPLPAAIWLMLGAVGGLGALRRFS